MTGTDKEKDYVRQMRAKCLGARGRAFVGRCPRFLRGRETEGNLDEAQGLCADPRNHAWVLIKCP